VRSGQRRSSVVILAEKASHPFYQAMSMGDDSAAVLDCQKASEWVHGGRADLVIIDCGFRIKVGHDLLRMIKAADPATIIILLGEGASAEAVIEVYNAGARTYLNKPVEISRLRDLVHQLLDLKGRTVERRSPYVQKEEPDSAGNVAVTSDIPGPLLRSVRFIEENFEDPIDLNACAREGCLSKYQFCRVFRRHFGLTPMRYVNMLRVKRAKGFLLRDDFNVTEIAHKVGFHDHGSFIRAFKKYTGFLPREYRNLAKIRPDA